MSNSLEKAEVILLEMLQKREITLLEGRKTFSMEEMNELTRSILEEM